MHKRDTGHFATHTCFLFNFISHVLSWCTNVTQTTEEYIHVYQKNNNNKQTNKQQKKGHKHTPTNTHKRIHIPYPGDAAKAQTKSPTDEITTQLNPYKTKYPKLKPRNKIELKMIQRFELKIEPRI